MHLKGELSAAEELYREILDADPGCSDAWNFLGILRFQQGDAGQAMELIRRAIELQPGEPGPHNNLANILRTTGKLEQAIEHYARAAELAPDDAEIRENHNKAVAAMKRTDEALEEFRSAVALNPDAAEVYRKAFRSMYAEGRTHETAEVFRRWLETDPENATARHMLAATLGEGGPDRASEAYVTETFDGFAETFDDTLEKLRYDVPRLAAAALERHWPGGRKIRSVLDAGCGTGLCGPLLKLLTQELVGVDLSPRMLLRASGRDVYDRLAQADLTRFLERHPQSFDAIVAADTLIYFGDLEPVLNAGRSSLFAGGLWIFSLEGLPDGDADRFRLTPSGRYAHSKAYVEELASDLGLSIESHEHIIARTERGKPVGGVLVVLRKPA